MAAQILTGGPAARVTQPDPVLTNTAADSSQNGGWIGDMAAPVHPVIKDYVRHAEKDSQTLLSTLSETIRNPGSRYNKLPRPVKTWLTSVIVENAVRVEVPQEDIDNAVSPEEPLLDAAQIIQNVLKFAIENYVFELFQPANFGSTQKTASPSLWKGTGTNIEELIEGAKVAVRKNSGQNANTIIIPPSKWPLVWASAEIKNLNWGYTHADLAGNGGLPPTVFGLKLVVPGVRTDSAPTGTFTPAFVWDDDDVRIFYTPSPNGEEWNGSDPTLMGQYENQKNGTAFEVRHRLSADYEEDGLHIVFGNIRRSLAEFFNKNLGFLITGI